ncbi:MAG: hypothetical protein Fur0034_10430 [Desulfuromonadia bacterium]
MLHRLRRPVVAICVLLLPILLAPGISRAALLCHDCHGTSNPPDGRPLDEPFRNLSTGGFPGHHRTHLSSGADRNGCSRCHIGSEGYTSSHRDGIIQLRGNINESPQRGVYTNISAILGNRTTVIRQTPNDQLGSCINVNCHFNSETPVWGKSGAFTVPDDCGRCHGAPPSDGNHPAATGLGAKHGLYYGTGIDSCRYCHTPHDGFGHATSSGMRPLSIRFTIFPNRSGLYSGDVSYPNYLTNPLRNGTCSQLYCHSDGMGGEPLQTPTWGGTLPGCRGCHGFSGDASLSGAHQGHTKGPSPLLTCDRCHNETADGNGGVKEPAKHVNRENEIVFREGGKYERQTKGCSGTRCHSDGAGGEANRPPIWTDSGPARCYWCHKGLTSDNTEAACQDTGGGWDPVKGICSPYVNMTSNGHGRLVGPQWVRKYPCTYCHNATVGLDGTISDPSRHMNGVRDVVISPEWNIVGRPPASFDPVSKSCDNLYCHSDGTTNPGPVKLLPWKKQQTACNTCHGHAVGTCNGTGCHDNRVDQYGRVWRNISGNQWPPGQEWKAAIPMFGNQGPGSERSNSHPRHVQTDFTCDICHAATIINGTCNAPGCHQEAKPVGFMGESAHINAAYHVNRGKDVIFRNHSGSYNPLTKTCSNTACHNGNKPQWGGSVNSTVICVDCHGSTTGDLDDFVNGSGVKARISLAEWYERGHGRYSSNGRYPISGNPAANFGSNACWYCHDPNVLHKDPLNPFRVRKHPQFEKRFDKECVYCHMEGSGSECLSCHDSAESLAPQIGTIGPPRFSVDHRPFAGNPSTCRSCHGEDSTIHKTGGRFWSADEKRDVKNQYVMMGVCLQCHDDDSNDQCTSCHVSPPENPFKYSLGFNPGMPGTRFIKPKKARASGAHFGFKHFRRYNAQSDKSTWPGGKFCWDCHDPHGDGNIFMIHRDVSTSTDGTFGIPRSRSSVEFSRRVSGQDYANSDTSRPYNRICNVCHSDGSRHYTRNSGDRHNESRPCTSCHEHRFGNSHASGQGCTTCHTNAKPIPKHTAFGLPRDCTKCHAGIIGSRTDIITQFSGTSHHVQGILVTNRHCYACHWEATPEGLIDDRYHEGYNYRLYTSVKNAPTDLVIWGPGARPTIYRPYSTVTRFTAAQLPSRSEVAKVTPHCISCHSDKNNDSQPFGDCRTPRQYAWDFQSIASRYLNGGTTTFGKYPTSPNASKKNQKKAFSAHGNGVNNEGGGWNLITGVDGDLVNTRGGGSNVECFDCHNSHGSNLVGTTSSYLTYTNTRNGGNLKETQAGKGGYPISYSAKGNASGVNPYEAGAGLCFDCHESAAAVTTPWGYQETFGATAPIVGYKDTPRFGDSGVKGSNQRHVYRQGKMVIGGHLKASSSLTRFSGTATNGTTTAIETSASWTEGAWTEFGVIIDSGANSGEIRMISSNGPSTITVTEAFPKPVAAGDHFRIVSYVDTVRGLCTTCHDPHGVSPIFGTNQAYAVPLLKGTWLTSPYKDDQPPPDPSGANAVPPRQWGHMDAPPTVSPETRYNLDRTLFGAGGMVNETPQQFGGLCIKCHRKPALTDGVVKNQPFRSVDRIHESVKGWGANTEHNYTCSKCHQPHTSGLPRLMVTNCLNFSHRGGRVSGGETWRAELTGGSNATVHGQYRGYPNGDLLGRYANPLTSCHGVAPLNPGNDPQKTLAQNWPGNQQWNSVTPW